MITDYYFPNGGFDFFDFDGVEGDTASAGAHWIESAVSYSGSESFPISSIDNDSSSRTNALCGYEIGISLTASTLRRKLFVF